MPEALTEQRISDFRREICDEAMAQFVERGVAGVSMRSLARALGYSATALYSYYRNKDEILAAARAHCLDQLADRLDESLAASTDPDARPTAFVKAYTAYARDHVPHYRLAFSLDQPPPERFPELAAGHGRVMSRFEHYIDLLRPGERDRQRQAAQAWAYLHGAVALHFNGVKALGKLDPERLHREIAGALLATVSDREGESAPDQPTRGEQMSFFL